MPNNTSCHVVVRGNKTDIETIIKKHFDDKTLDFNSIIPMPEALKGTSEGSVRMRGQDLMHNSEGARSYIMRRAAEKDITVPDGIDVNQLSHGDMLALALDVEPEIVFEGLDALRCLEEYGARSWYDWSIDNWGTKWGAYYGEYETTHSEAGTSKLDIHFCTAWSPASPVISALSEMYPDVEIEHHFLDEGGDFACTEIYANGQLITGTDHDWAWFAESHFGYEFSDDE
ncbi:hypothetical protein HER14_19645 [Acidithiobacillus thiooxidans]|uniref:DUF1281 family ferredoxin-like fold protein n=1 Tax=Acidithiobacillus thiooxidans TaxID=930 RepID=UPI001C07ADD6|nr:hypothetical protein [Acidithiobacillus thiooxidans]MBU2753080.1 hypothetical protein [Acidithiobacillus thiooxidans]